MSVCSRMAEDQPDLAKRMQLFIGVRADGDEEASKMVEVAALTYRLLEAQGQADAMNDQFGLGPSK